MKRQMNVSRCIWHANGEEALVTVEIGRYSTCVTHVEAEELVKLLTDFLDKEKTQCPPSK